VRRAVLGSSLFFVFSRPQIRLQAEFLGLSRERFLFLPFKADQSKRPPLAMRIGDYVFSGGNNRRDYRTLFEAVRGTNIPVIVSATDPRVTAGLDVPENVVLLAAREPAFARLTAGARFSVIPLTRGGVRGAGESNMLNAMWQGNPIICADDISAADYIENGVTGFVVSSGDVESLRSRICELWNDPARAAEMGRRGHEHVAAGLTHDHFVRRMLALAVFLGRK
jgi:glycosyltransferase involved in cell wall biosynthesis